MLEHHRATSEAHIAKLTAEKEEMRLNNAQAQAQLQSKQQHDAEQAKVATTVQRLSDRVADAVSANKQLQL